MELMLKASLLGASCQDFYLKITTTCQRKSKHDRTIRSLITAYLVALSMELITHASLINLAQHRCI